LTDGFNTARLAPVAVAVSADAGGIIDAGEEARRPFTGSIPA
jgi:hypothetical protein